MKIYQPIGDAEPIIVIKSEYQALIISGEDVELLPASLALEEVGSSPLNYEDVTDTFDGEITFPKWTTLEFMEAMYLQFFDDGDGEDTLD